jgi:hypothetical protein
MGELVGPVDLLENTDQSSAASAVESTFLFMLEKIPDHTSLSEQPFTAEVNAKSLPGVQDEPSYPQIGVWVSLREYR